MTWDQGFPEDRESYRSRARAKKRKEQEEEDRLINLERKNEEILAIVKHQHKQIEELREQGATHQLQQDSQGSPSQQRSNMASTGVGADEAPMDRYPVDDIRERTSCELHVGVRNLSLKAADGYALTC